MKIVEKTYFLKEKWAAKILANTTFADNSWNLPKNSWLFNKFYPFFQDELFRLGAQKWTKKWDCEDFAREFKSLAQICHNNSPLATAEGLAIGEIDYTKESGERHCINIAFTDKGVIFIEPQTGESLLLTENEKNSITRFNI